MTIDGAYLTSGSAALNALPPDEAAEFQTFADEDDMVAAELAGFRETAALLGSVVAETPPASMRLAVMQLIANTRQLPPLTESGSGRHYAAAAEVKEEPAAPANVSSLAVARERKSRQGMKWLMAVAAAAVIGVGTFFFVNQDEEPQLADPLATCVQNDQSAKQFTATPESEGTSVVTLSTSCNAATFTVSGLDGLSPDQVYQLWVMKGAESARSVALLHTDSNGWYPSFTAPLEAGDTDMGISIEPAAGSPAPTTDPVVVVPISI